MAIGVFSFSFFLLSVLILLKRIESVRGKRYFEPVRVRADHGARQLKRYLEVLEIIAENTPFFVFAVLRYGIHVGALGFARAARRAAREAHRLADVVSHKHRFERRETTSDYLKQVAEKPGDNVAEE